MRWAAAALVWLVCACTTATPQAGVPSSSAAVHSPSPPAAQSVAPFSRPTFKCRLPITLFSGDVRSGAFIDFPSGAVTPDPASAEVNVIPLPGLELIDKAYGLYYDRAYARWLPVNRNAVSPDGTHYAYTDQAISGGPIVSSEDMLEVVEVKTGIHRTFDIGPSNLRFAVVDYASEGIYIRTAGSVGADFVDPITGEMHLDSDPGTYKGSYQGSAGNGLFWEAMTNRADPNPFDGVGPNELDKVNLTSLNKAVWFYRPGISVQYLTQDPQGRPIIVVTTGEVNSQEDILYLPSPGVSREILHFASDVPPISDPIADSHGVWFGAHDGIYLYTVSGGLRQVSRQGGLPANGCF